MTKVRSCYEHKLPSIMAAQAKTDLPIIVKFEKNKGEEKLAAAGK